MFTFEEMPDSRTSTDTPPSITLRYIANGEHSDALVRAYARALTPAQVLFFDTGNLLYRKSISIQPAGWANYVIEVPYEEKNPVNLENGSFTFNFDTTGATVTVKAAKEHIATYPNDEPTTANPHKGAIGVSKGGEPEGAEIVIPALKINYAFKHPEAVVDEAFARQMARYTGRTNSDEFRGFQPGELLFLGGTGSDGTENEAEVNYSFIASSNETELTIGEIANIVKDGHHYLWIEFKDEVEDGDGVCQPKQIHIERVYDSISFADCFGWS